MRILVGWDDATEAETIGLCMNVDANDTTVMTDPQAFEEAAKRDAHDVVLMALSFPDQEESFALFQRLRKAQPDVPVIGVWYHSEIIRLAKFITAGLHSHVSRDDEGDFIFLLTSLVEATHAAVIAERTRIIADKLREEIQSVRRLQESIIPQKLPTLMDYHAVARYEPSRLHALGSKPVVMAGGDYYDAFSLDERRWSFLVGDASGHGVRACMSIMTMHTLIHMIREQRWPETDKFVETVNRRLCDSEIVQGEGGFITLLFLTLDILEHRLQWTSAGHPMPLVQDLATNEIRPMGSDEQGGLPLGIDEDWEFEACSAEIPDNSRVLLYTDGLDEAFPADQPDNEDSQFGLKGIVESMRKTRDKPLDVALDTLFQDSEAATLGSGRHDDTSVILLQRGGKR